MKKVNEIFYFSIVIMIGFLPLLGRASQPKRGISVCLKGDCNFSNGPLGIQEEGGKQRENKPIQVIPEYSQVGELSKSGLKVYKKPIKLSKHQSTTQEGTKADADSTNLPPYYQGYKKTSPEEIDLVVYVPGKKADKLSNVYVGDTFRAVIEQELEVSSQVKQPIRAILITGPYKRSILVGEASLDLELKRVLLDFNRLRVTRNNHTFNVKAVGLSQNGTLGIKGEYHSELGKFFVAEALSAFAAAALDSTIQRNQNALGGYTSEPSLGNSAKTGAVSALSKTTDRFAETVKSAPEYTTVSPWQEIQILIQDEPKEEK